MATPTIAKVTITAVPADEWKPASVRVTTTWTGADRTDGLGFIVSNRRVAERLRTAILAGAVFTNPQIRTDVNGRTYVSADSKVLAKRANADLRRLGF